MKPQDISNDRVCRRCGRPLRGFEPFGDICLPCSLEPGLEVEQGIGCGLRRFENYELIAGEDGRPIELGRGAMGVTYKAFDLDLHCPVALKIISERYLGDEVATVRFLREARAAASIRDPNVASVLHLGRTGDSYFYTMEFVEGETLERFVKRSVRVRLDLALEIVSQIAKGLEAVHRQKLVHRDIKPGNIMLRLEQERVVTVKIIDLGLSKAVEELDCELPVSMPAAFAGTPEFASPEQFAGADVDIRSDLYSLGVTLWQMLTGELPFTGSLVEVIHQHEHVPAPLERLQILPPIVTRLIASLLEKDPKRRFQTPGQLHEKLRWIQDSLGVGRSIASQRSHNKPISGGRSASRANTIRPGPEKLSIGRLPITEGDVFGREEDLTFLDDAWANPKINIVSIVAWAGVGKSTLVNCWLRQLAALNYHPADRVFGWSFYRQGTRGISSSADEFIDAALIWFGDPDPHIGTPWEKGERLARLVSDRRTLLVLDGMEPLQNPPGPQEGRIREPSLQSLLRQLSSFNQGLCVITTRLTIADLQEYEHSSVRRRDLEELNRTDGAKLLKAMGVRGDEEELRQASDEFKGHCLALTLLGSYLTDAYSGEIRFRAEVAKRLVHDVRQGGHARKVMASYQEWFGECAEISLLRLLGLFDRPISENTVEVLLKPPTIRGLTESFSESNRSERRSIIARLRRARLLSPEDPRNPGHLDTHPLVREYFGEQLRTERTQAWKESNRRLYFHYQKLAPQMPNSLREMEPLFSAVIFGCNAGLFREALHNVYIPRIQQGSAFFAVNVLGARGVLLLVLAHFFKRGHWGCLPSDDIEGQSLTPEDQLFILTQAGLNLTAARGLGAPEARICYERAEALCQEVHNPLLLHVALVGQWRYSLITDRLDATMQLAARIRSRAKEHKEAVLMMGAYRALAATRFFAGDFMKSRRYARHGLRIWHAKVLESPVEEPIAPVVSCLAYQALCDCQMGDAVSCREGIVSAASTAKRLKDMHALGQVLWFAGIVGYFENDPAKVESTSLELIDLSTRQNFPYWLAVGNVLHGWARSASGQLKEGLSWIERGLNDYRGTASVLDMPYLLALNADALCHIGRITESLETIGEAEALVEQYGQRWCTAELQRLRGVSLIAVRAEESRIENSFAEAMRTANQQRASLQLNRAKTSYSVYRRQ